MPRVTVCVPTYNRAASLRRAVGSVIAQTYRDLVVRISDNASTDETPEVARELAADERVEVVRRPVNLGLTGNFNAMFAEAQTEYVMVLADDDWLEPGYVEQCVAALDADPGLVIASGAAISHAADGTRTAGAAIDLPERDPATRVRRYFTEVQDNVTIYGLMRRSALQRALPMQNRLAGDWLLCGRMAMQGRVRTLPSTGVNRSATGTSASYARTVRSMGLTAREGRWPHLSIAGFIYGDIAHDAAVYAPLGPARRRLGAACALAVLRARPFNLVEDALAPYMGRPRLRRIDRALRPVAQRLQR